MKMQIKVRQIAGLIALAALMPLAAGAEAILHGRVSFDAGGTLVKGQQESDWSNASVNTLVLPGDTLWVDNGGTSEVEFSGGTFLRMADGSKAEIVEMPPNATVRGWIGSFYVQRLSRSSGSMIFYTPAATIEIDNDSSVRVDIVSEGVTTVSTRWGRATIRTDAGGSVQAHAGRRVFVEAGLLPSEPTPFDRSAEDAFDRWNRERAEFLATGGSGTPTSVPISNDTIGVSDLDRYGEWVTVDNRPYWRPTVVVDYTPYHNGYWNYVGNVGNVWVGNYPFCYVTSHYGYWDYNRTYGWVWGYRPQWSPAWCATVQYGDYFVWAPVNRYYRPVYPHTSAYFSIGGVNFGYFGTSYCHVSSLYRGPSYVYYANHDPFRRYYGTPNVTINIWNINTGNRSPHVRVPFNDSVTTVRDYTPRRRIRGADTLFTSSRSASERVRSLESTSGRESFSRAGRTGGQFSRTEASRIDAGSRTRNVRIDQQAPDYSRASRSNPIVASNRQRSGGEAESLTVSNTRDRQGGPRTQAGAARDSESVRGSVERGTTRGTEAGSATTRGGERASGTRTARTDIDPAFGTTPVQTRIAPATRSRTETPGRTSVPERSDVSPNTRSRAPESAAPSGSRSTVERTRTPVRTSVPQVTEAPGRVSSPRGADSFTGSTPVTRSSAGGSREVSRERTEPRASATPPSRSSAPERTAPPAASNRQSRTVEPSRTPQPRVTVPSQERSVPINRAPVTSPSQSDYRREPVQAPQSSGRSVAPSRGNDSPRSYTAPSYTAPSRSSERAPSYSAPSRSNDSPRSYSAPSRSSERAPSYTAPSRSSDSSRSYSAPSRSNDSPRSYTAPSRGGDSGAGVRQPSSAREGGGRGR